MTLHMIEESVKDHWIERKIVINYDGNTRTVTQYHFTVWDDDEFDKKQIESLVRFVSSVRAEANKTPQPGPIVVHCSNGCGRTGTFITIDRLLQQMKENSSVNIREAVCQLREHRISMVENYKQYLMLYKSVECVLGNLYDELIPNSAYVNEVQKNGQVIYEDIPELYMDLTSVSPVETTASTV